MELETGGSLQIDHDARSARYFQNAVDRHWNPEDIDLTADRETLVDADLHDMTMDALRMGLARFGAGEQAVTEDLAPLAAVLEGIEDQMFLTSQLYEEAKHTAFFDRYWREVIHPVEEARGLPRSSPTQERWFNEDYWELFDRNEAAVARLLEEDTPKNRALAYTHYHLTIEGILAQTGYYGMQSSYSGDKFPELPHLPGLVEGFSLIRSDEGRHVGFGMAKLKDLLDAGVDPEVITDTVDELIPFVNGITEDDEYASDRGMPEGELEDYAAEKHFQRMDQIMDASQDIPDVDQLTKLEGGA